jgi:hypothetical protein
MCYVCKVIVELFSPKEASCAWPCRDVLTDMVALFRRHIPLLSAERLYHLVVKSESTSKMKQKESIKLITPFGP